MAETILVDIAGKVLSSLGSYAIQHIGLSCGVKGELRKMENNISTLKNVLLVGSTVKEWLERLKLILYDAEDLLDEVATETKEKPSGKLDEEDEIVLQMNAFKFVGKLVERPVQINRREETTSFVNTVTVIGRDADKEKLVRCRTRPSRTELKPLGVEHLLGEVGCGDHDKVALAHTDIQSRRISPYGGSVVIDLEILEEGFNGGWRKDSMATPADVIQAEWRRCHVRSCRGLGDGEVFFIGRREGGVDIIWAFKEGDESKHPNLVNIGKKIVEKCGGVPLAARTLGAFLFSKTNERDWLFVRDNEMWAIVQKENDILPILKLSYDQMPSYLKHCIAYCSLFEKDEIIYGTELIYAWNALGFVQCVDTEDELEDIGEGYILELVRRFFLERYYTKGSLVNPVKREKYKVHDLVHDLTQYVAGNESLTVKGATTKAILETVRHVSFDFSTYCSFPRPLMEAEKLRTIVYPSNRERTVRSPLEPAFASFRSLRVLEGLGLPENIGKLKLLRYISINAPADLPNSLCMLLNLQYLDLSESYVSGLPEDFYKLISLRFLALTTTSMCLPKEAIGRCNLNTSRYREGGEDWSKIAHVPNIEIDDLSMIGFGLHGNACLETVAPQ
ncbi:hypothetical protein RHSIM_Rhsim03G0042600 [Rhododendron simsii]|uniref:Uncharacterized protein n=1 Tax=Rhododendron simsii TaxID=118357 RepID=A0A834LUX9_RHOSS|nr:hypothetical protein RHSIM_Rhsim03G0042600 [Rhododendron simsii]